MIEESNLIASGRKTQVANVSGSFVEDLAGRIFQAAGTAHDVRNGEIGAVFVPVGVDHIVEKLANGTTTERGFGEPTDWGPEIEDAPKRKSHLTGTGDGLQIGFEVKRLRLESIRAYGEKRRRLAVEGRRVDYGASGSETGSADEGGTKRELGVIHRSGTRAGVMQEAECDEPDGQDGGGDQAEWKLFRCSSGSRHRLRNAGSRTESLEGEG